MSTNKETATLLDLADGPTSAQITDDLGSGYLRWQFDDYTAALVTAQDRVAIVLYPAETAEDGHADFEVADWYEERISNKHRS